MNNNDSGERRHHQRVLFDAPVILHTGDDSYDTTLVDISLKGTLTKEPANWHLPNGEKVTLTIYLDDADTAISMQTHFVHAENGCVGFYCDEIDMGSITHLRRLVELNLGDSTLLERELASLG